MLLTVFGESVWHISMCLIRKSNFRALFCVTILYTVLTQYYKKHWFEGSAISCTKCLKCPPCAAENVFDKTHESSETLIRRAGAYPVHISASFWTPKQNEHIAHTCTGTTNGVFQTSLLFVKVFQAPTGCTLEGPRAWKRTQPKTSVFIISLQEYAQNQGAYEHMLKSHFLINPRFWHTPPPHLL